MRAECLSGAMPHLSALYRDYLAKSAAALKFYATYTPAPRAPLPLEQRTSISQILSRQNQGWGASAKGLENIERLREGASAIVTGQQVALFGGPMYAILKALTAIRYAEAATKTGVDCVPIFWLASEDHDLAEVSSATLLDHNGRLVQVDVKAKAKAGAPAGGVRFNEEIQVATENAVATFADAETAELVRRCYTRGETFAGSFARLFARLFGEFGLILLDPSDIGFHELGKPLLRAAAERAPQLNEALLKRGKELEAAGYHAQVKVAGSSTLLFALQDGARTAVHRTNGGFSIGKEKLSEKELVARMEAHPEDFSGNALFRPVIQDHLLPTLAYIGGPAEVAYFAQAEVVYKALTGRVTPILPRMSATLVDAKAERLLQRYSLRVPETFVSAEELRNKIIMKSLPPALSSRFGATEKAVKQQLAELSAELRALDPTLEDAAKRATSKMDYQLSRLKRRAVAAETRKGADSVRHSAFLSNSLYPRTDLQERSIAGTSFLGRHGMALLRQLYERLDLACAGHQVVRL